MCEKIPVTVIVTTKNEERNIGRCLSSLDRFSQVIVVDSHSGDRTCDIAKHYGAEVVLYHWDGCYPKKRQWCLSNINIGYNWILFIDADEVVTNELLHEISGLSEFGCGVSGYFVSGMYVWGRDPLKYGLRNNKLVLFDRRKFEFPKVDDLDIDGMGEIEGHYQPVLKQEYIGHKIGRLKSPLMHYAYDDRHRWEKRHLEYARWEAEMTLKNRWPNDPIFWRNVAKRSIRTSKIRPQIMFIYFYIIRFGFLDGKAGFDFAWSRYLYCRRIMAYYNDLKR